MQNKRSCAIRMPPDLSIVSAYPNEPITLVGKTTTPQCYNAPHQKASANKPTGSTRIPMASGLQSHLQFHRSHFRTGSVSLYAKKGTRRYCYNSVSYPKDSTRGYVAQLLPQPPTAHQTRRQRTFQVTTAAKRG